MNETIPYSAPEFTLKSADGTAHSLNDYRGKWVVLYFYPKDDTPGCTAEACSFRDYNEPLMERGATVIGVSRDLGDSHEAFMKKYSLNFLLLSDPDHAVMEKYSAWGNKMFGNEGVLRKTFIINPNGQVVKVYGKVTPIGHGQQVLESLRSLQEALA